MFIVATIGVNSLTKESIKRIILAGADALRFNFSYRTVEENVKNIEMAQEIIDELNSKTKILVDLPIKKQRLGSFDLKAFAVRESEEFIFKSASYSLDCNEFIPVNIQKLGEKVNPNQTITLGDGEIALQIIEIIDADTVRAKILNNGIIYFNKAFNISSHRPEAELIEEYKKIIKEISALEPKYITIPFINNGFNEEFKKYLKLNYNPKIILKIEQTIQDDELTEIFKDNFYEAITVERGEIGVNIPFEKVGILQKKICSQAKKFKKRVIISTQILESTITHFTPVRSEILDLTNIVIDGAYGIIFCHETGFGTRPAYSISVAKKIIEETNKYIHAT